MCNKEVCAKKYPLIDVFKFICACLVIMIHCVEIKEGHPIAHMIVTCFSQQAVPFFFIVSGFFFCNKLVTEKNQKQYILKYAGRLLILYLIWILISLPEMLSTYLNLYENESFVRLAAILFRRIFFAGYGVFWYLLVLAEAALLAGFLLVFKKKILLYAFAVLGLIYGYIYTIGFDYSIFEKINSLIYLTFSWKNNVLLVGLPFFAIGCIFASMQEHKLNINIKSLLAAYIAVTAINIVVFAVAYENINMYEKYFFLYIIQSVLLFVIGVNAKCSLRLEMCSELRNISSAIYCTHTFFIYHLIDKYWTLNSPVLFRFFFSFALCLILYYIIKFTKSKMLLKILTLK